ncbi:hypothetical protein C8J56DRAFT_882213 [Mycena floridula]|nr:hypothetical protein C8J56DRAFT_882213 [Mycena floridula]
MQRTPVSARQNGRPRVTGATLLTAPSTVNVRANFATPLIPYNRLRNGHFRTEEQRAAERIDERTKQVESLRQELGSTFNSPAPATTPVSQSHRSAIDSAPPSRGSQPLQSRHASTPGSALQSMGSINTMFSPRNPSLLVNRPLPHTTSSQFGAMFNRALAQVPNSLQNRVQVISPPPRIPPIPSFAPVASAPVESQGWQQQRVLTDEEMCQERDRMHPDIRAIQLNGSPWPSSTKNLSLISLNFPAWNRALDNVLSVNGQLRLHITSPEEYFCPGPTLFPTSALNWKTNDQAIVGFIKSKVQTEEYISYIAPWSNVIQIGERSPKSRCLRKHL